MKLYYTLNRNHSSELSKVESYSVTALYNGVGM